MAAINLREISQTIIDLLPETIARENVILPLTGDLERLTVAYPHDLPDSELPELRDKLRFVLNRPVELIAMRREELQDAIDWHYHYGTIETCGGTRLRIEFRCPRQWSQLVPTEDATVRYCTECQEPVYLCATDDELVAHAQANHCVARLGDLSAYNILQEFVDSAIDFVGEVTYEPSPADLPRDPSDPPPPPRIEVPAASPRLLNELRSLFRPIK